MFYTGKTDSVVKPSINCELRSFFISRCTFFFYQILLRNLILVTEGKNQPICFPISLCGSTMLIIGITILRNRPC